MQGLLELTGCKGLLELTVQTLTECTNLLESAGHTSVLGLTGCSRLLELTVYTILLKLAKRTGF